MKNIKTKIILSAIIFLSVIALAGTVNAAGASLYVSPVSTTKTVGNTFGASVGFTASGNKVCAVEGTLVFNNLSCQGITVSSDVMAQSSPTCSNPYFLIGVPNCTTSDKVLLTVSAKAGNAGTASISLTGVDIIGEGASVGSTSTGGNYTINAVPKPVPTPTPTPKPTQQVTESTEQTTEEVETPAEQTAQENNVPTGIGAEGQQASLATASSPKTITTIIIILLTIAVIGGGWYMLNKKKKKEA